MEGTFKLRKPIVSKKFGVIYPANTTLNGFVDHEMRIFAEHPSNENLHIRVSELNIVDAKWKTDYKKISSNDN